VRGNLTQVFSRCTFLKTTLTLLSGIPPVDISLTLDSYSSQNPMNLLAGTGVRLGSKLELNIKVAAYFLCTKELTKERCRSLR